METFIKEANNLSNSEENIRFDAEQSAQNAAQQEQPLQNAPQNDVDAELEAFLSKQKATR